MIDIIVSWAEVSGDAVVRDFSTDHVWQTIGIEVLAREARANGMTCEQVGPVIGVLRPELP
ncbi:hypothetical protein [Nocardia arizonensis]|uniref:hypothetical protein n=1 Tax=Nocardia arizonensis TaxID=1141647 RepID=UPI0012E2911F|nr:hypothetical protein [Nocardia arizonensis]